MKNHKIESPEQNVGTGRLAGKICVITGGGQGIGRASAELFSREGAWVFIIEKNEHLGHEAAIACGEKANFIQADIADPVQVEAAFELIKQQHGRLDVLYNNASIFIGDKDGPVDTVSADTWRQIIEVNLFGLYLCSQKAIPLLQANGGGCIINTSSSAGLIGIPGCDAYTATKGATVSLTRSMAVEYGPDKIRVNCIAPAAIATEMVKESSLKHDSFDENTFLKLRSPLRRYGSAEEIAKIALFLASDDSSYVNGAVIVGDGGLTINGDLSKVNSNE
jgi:NAD(P)-dependent dehydrogenase (short-subunit alcohol dehydrogenase family)